MKLTTAIFTKSHAWSYVNNLKLKWVAGAALRESEPWTCTAAHSLTQAQLGLRMWIYWGKPQECYSSIKQMFIEYTHQASYFLLLIALQVFRLFILRKGNVICYFKYFHKRTDFDCFYDAFEGCSRNWRGLDVFPEEKLVVRKQKWELWWWACHILGVDYL